MDVLKVPQSILYLNLIFYNVFIYFSIYVFVLLLLVLLFYYHYLYFCDVNTDFAASQ